jgi:hypothetical protein
MDVDAIEALLAKATPGPWRASTDRADDVYISDAADVVGIANMHYCDDCDGATANAKAIVALINAAPTLLTELRRLREVEAAVRDLGSARREYVENTRRMVNDARDAGHEDADDHHDGIAFHRAMDARVAVERLDRRIRRRLCDDDCFCGAQAALSELARLALEAK